MLRYLRHAGVLALMFAVAAPAFAQGPGGRGGARGGFGGGFGGGMGRGGSAYSLLSNPTIQEELALSDEQKTKSSELLESYRGALRGDQQPGQSNFRDMSEEERAAMRKQFEERTAKVNSEYKAKFADVLDEVQVQRLQQINWQIQGNRALRDAELAKELGLTQEQQDKITAIYSEGTPGAGGPRGPRGQGGQPGGNAEDRQARMAEFQARIEKQNSDAKAVLTADQNAQLEKLLGPKFDTNKLRQERGGPGGEGRNRGPGNRPQRQNDNI